MAEVNTSHECVPVDVNLHDPRNTFVSILTTALRKKIQPSKAPAHFAESLEKTCQTHGPSLPKTLLKAHLNVWIAYFLVGENLEGLDKLSAKDLDFVTAEVANAPIDHFIDQFITRFFNQSQRSKKYQGE
jgi:hypothetical protein